MKGVGSNPGVRSVNVDFCAAGANMPCFERKRRFGQKGFKKKKKKEKEPGHQGRCFVDQT